eukprot:9199286-Pyramimonas_sp.AAC.1
MDIFSFKRWAGAEMPKGLETLLAATMWRTATKTLTSWPALLRDHREVAEDRLPVRQVIEGAWCAECWMDKFSIAQRFDMIFSNQ